MTPTDREAPSGSDETDGGSPRKGHRGWRRLVRALLALATLVLAAAAILGFRLSRGPIALDFLTDRAERALDEQLDPLEVEIGGVVLTWTRWSRPLDLRVHDVRVSQTGSEDTLLELSDMGVRLSAGALLRGRISLRGIELTAIRLHLERSEDGTFGASLLARDETAPRRTEPHLPDLSSALDDWLDPDTANPLGRLERILLRDAELVVDDRKLDQEWRMEELGLDLRRRRRRGRIDADLALSLELGDRPIPIEAEARYSLEEHEMSASLELEELVLSDLAARVPLLERLDVFDRAAAVSVAVTTRDGFELASAEIDLESDRARIKSTVSFGDTLDALEARIVVDRLDPWEFAGATPALAPLARFEHPLRGEATLAVEDGTVRSVELEVAGADPSGSPGQVSGKAELSGEPRTIAGSAAFESLEPWRLAALGGALEALGAVQVSLSGDATFQVTGTSLDSLELDLESAPGTVAIPALRPEPLALGPASLRGRVSDGLGRIELEDASVVLDGQPVSAAMHARRDDDSGTYQGHLDIGVEEVPLDWVVSLWPADVGEKVRQWVVESISGATGGPAELAVDVRLEPGDDPRLEIDELLASFPFQDADVQVLSPELVLRDVAGQANLTLERLDFDVTSGRYEDLEIGPTHVSIRDMQAHAPLSIEATIEGPIETAVATLTGQPLTLFPAERARGLSGSTKSELSLTLPLRREGPLTWDDVQATVTGTTHDLAWLDSPLGQPLDRGELEFTFADDAFQVRGSLRAAGAPSRVDLRAELGPSPPSIDVEVESRIDEAAARALGVPELSFLTGAVDVEARFRQVGDDRNVDLSADLTDLAVELAPLGWSKSAGSAGSLKLEARSTPDGGWVLDDIELGSLELAVAGRITLEPDAVTPSRVEIDALQIGQSRLAAELTRLPSNAWRAQVTGTVLDAAPLVRYAKGQLGPRPEDGEPTPGDEARSIELVAQIHRVILSPKSKLHDFGLSARFSPRETKLNAYAGINGDATVNVAFGPDGEGDGYRGLLTSSDASALLAAFEIPAVTEGGSVELSLRSPTLDGPYSGALDAREFVLLEDPTLMNILSLGTFRNLIEQLEQKGLDVIDLHSEYAYDAGRLTIRNGRAHGSGFLLTLTGTVDFAEREHALDGSFAPATTLERVIGKIPLVNWLILGPHKEGFIAAEFTISGPFDEPDLDVHPLSALTPGITRVIQDAFSHVTNSPNE